MKKEYFCKSINKSKFPNMKIIRFVFLLVLWFTTATLSAQNLKLFHEDVEVSNGEINIAELTSDGEVKVIINIQNTSSDAIDIKVKKNVREDIEGAENTFCLGSCFDSSVTESPVSHTIGAGETTDSDDFYILFLPHGNVGHAMIMYSIFNVADPEDNVTVTVNFTFTALSLSLFHNDEDVSNGEFSVSEETTEDQIKVVINIRNNTDGDIDIKVKKNVRQDIEGAENTFCLGSCFDPSVIESPVTYTIGAGETTDADDFYVLFLPHGNVGEALIVYDVFNANNPEDRVNVTVHFTITPTGIGLTENDVVLNLYPNPASGNSLTVEYSLPNVDNTELVIYNMLGERLIVQPVLQPTGILGVDISKLTKGIYIVSFEQSGLSLVTRKYIISR